MGKMQGRRERGTCTRYGEWATRRYGVKAGVKSKKTGASKFNTRMRRYQNVELRASRMVQIRGSIEELTASVYAIR